MGNNRDNHGPMGPIGPQLIIPSSFADALSYAQQLEWLYLHKQDKLVAGENVAINENDDGTATISVIGSLDARGIKSITGTLGLDGTTVTVTLTDDTTQQFFVQRGPQGISGQDGSDGSDGVSPEVTIENITDGHRVTITDAEHPSGQSFDVMNGSNGQDGSDGSDGVSPVVTVTSITGGNRVTITDAEHPSGQSFDVMNGQAGSDGSDGADGGVFWTCAGGHNYELSDTYYFYIANISGPAGRTPQLGDVIISVESPTAVWALTITEVSDTSVGAAYFANIKGSTGSQGNPGPAGEGVPTGGTQGQVLSKASGTNYDTEWVDPSGLPAVVDHTQDLVVGVNAGGQPGWKSLDALYPKIDKVQNVIGKVYRNPLAALGPASGNNDVIVSLTDIGDNQYRFDIQNNGEESATLPLSVMIKANGSGDCFVTVESGTGMASLQGYNNNGTMRYDYMYFEGFFTIAAGTTESTVIELHPGTGSLSITDTTNYYSYVKYDAQNGIPKGGTTGQKLVKSSNSNFATQWVDDNVKVASGNFRESLATISVTGKVYDSSGAQIALVTRSNINALAMKILQQKISDSPLIYDTKLIASSNSDMIAQFAVKTASHATTNFVAKSIEFTATITPTDNDILAMAKNITQPIGVMGCFNKSDVSYIKAPLFGSIKADTTTGVLTLTLYGILDIGFADSTVENCLISLYCN